MTSVTLSDNHIRQVVDCHSLSDLSDRFIESKKPQWLSNCRNDGGGSFLKMIFTHIQVRDDDSPLRSQVQKTVKLMSKTSGKQQLLLALSQDSPETYHNVKAIFDLIKVQEKCYKDFIVISCDLNLVNIMRCIKSHSNKHPCCWCDAESTNLLNCDNTRTFGGVRTLHADSMISGDIRKSKEFKNVICVPLLQFPDHKLVLEAISPMELHLLFMVVNHLFKSLCDLWPGAKEWLVKLHIPIQP